LEKINYKGVEIHLTEHKDSRYFNSKPGHMEVFSTYSAKTSYGAILYNDFGSRDKESTVARAKAYIDAVDILVARTDEQLADYLAECIVDNGKFVIHPVLMKMVLGNSRIPNKPTKVQQPEVLKPWYVRIKDWIENWNRKPILNGGKS
jgi:hypothetical protein